MGKIINIMLAVAILVLPLIFGLFEPFFRLLLKADNEQYFYGVAIIYLTLVILVIGIYAIVDFARGAGVKGFIIAILFILVLIPLAVFGTCVSTSVGAFLRNLFFK